MRIVVVGAGAAGMAAATRARRVNPQAEIVVIEASEDFSRGTCSLPYLLSNEIHDPSTLSGTSLESLAEKRIDLRLRTKATNLIPLQRKLETDGACLEFDKIIVSTGSVPLPGQPLGLDNEHPRVWQLRRVQDVLRIQRELQDPTLQKIAVIGGGYVGLELAEALTSLGRQVTIFQRGPSLVRLFPFAQESLVQRLVQHGIQVRLETEVVAVDPGSGQLQEKTSNGKIQVHRFEAFADCRGINPCSELLSRANANLGANGAVKVNLRGETSISNVYACGDGVELPNSWGGQGRWIPLATTAARLGRVCGENAAGGNRRLGACLGALAVRIFNDQLGIVGQPCDWHNSQRIEFEWGLEQTPFDPRKKGRGILFCDPNSEKIKGLQVIGPDASHLVNLIAMATEAELTVTELQDQDYCYNPPLSALWHPLYLASRQFEKQSTQRSRGLQI